MKILLRPNFERENTAAVLLDTITKLLELGLQPMLTCEASSLLGGAHGCVVGDEKLLLSDCDVLMAVGGDGTVLRAAHDAILFGKPLIGVNSGQVGFLTQIEPSELPVLERLARGDYTISGRMLLKAEIIHCDNRRFYTALNDIVVRREDTNRILTISVHDSDRLVLRQRADGVIFATPTGSTAYSLSAGGPVVSPEMSAAVLTPICPHGTFRCSLVLPPEHTYTITESGGQNCGFTVAVDGCHIGCHQQVNISRSHKEIKLIDLGHRDFYKNLNEKLVIL